MPLTLPPPHVRAWYCYAFAAEVFAACAMAIFLPITLEYMARDIGYLMPELKMPCSSAAETGAGSTITVCKAELLGIWVDTASFSMYVKSVAVALQALCIISVGPLADRSYWRKRLLVTFAMLGATAGTLFLALPTATASTVPVLAALLTIVGNIAYAVSIVCSNAFLPALAKEDEAVRLAWNEVRGEDADDNEDRYAGSLMISNNLERIASAISAADLAEHPPPTSTPQSRYDTLLSVTTSRISSVGTAVGFFSGVSVLALLLIPVMASEGSTSGLCTAIAISGMWWGVFTVPAWIGLPGGMRDEVPGDERDSGKEGRGLGWIGQGWIRVSRMVRPAEMKAIPNLFTFLLAWIFLSDGFHSTTYVAILYASSTLRMSSSKVILIGILVQLAAVASSLLAPRLQRRLGYPNLKLLLVIVLLAEAIPVYACLGLVLPWGGLRSEGEMYGAAIWFGMLYGPFNSYSRAVYAELIPPSHESSFFSLFALTDKSASFLGPLVVGVIADTTGNIRLGFLFLLLLLAVPVPVLLRVNMEAGRNEAQAWSERKKGDEGEHLLAG